MAAMLAKRKILTSGIVLLMVVALGAWAVLRGQGGVEYRAAPVQRGEIAATISATGNPNAVVTVQVGSQVSGNILALYADFNTHVTKGQLVARIDPQVFQARVDQAKANLDAANAAVGNAQANVQKARAEVASAKASVADSKANVMKSQVAVQDSDSKLKRRVQLAQEGVISREDLDTAQTTYDSAVAAVEAAKAQQQAAQENVSASEAQEEVARTQLVSAQAQVKQVAAALEQANLDLDHTFIRAPVEGTVVARHVDVGQTVAASLQAPTLFEIAQDLADMQVDTNVSEADVGRVSVGQTATFSVDAYPGRIFRGTVREIRKAPINVQNVITYDAVIAVSNADLKLFPGMTANVKILVDKREDALKAPNAALRFRPANAEAPRRGAGQTVWVLDQNEKPRAVAVTAGISDGTFTEISGGGLKEGDRVIVAAFSRKEAASGAAFRGGSGGGGARRGPGF